MGKTGIYYFLPEYKNSDGVNIWSIITEYISKNGNFRSVTGIVYKAQINENSLYFIGGKEGTKRATFGDTYSKSEIVEVFNKIKKLDFINTNIINDREYISETFSYKRAPFIGLLYTIGIITNKEI